MASDGPAGAAIAEAAGGDGAGPRGSILNAAMHLFGKQGFTGTSMRDIGNAVGVLPGSLYAHIDSKDALLVAIVADGIRRFLAAVEPHANGEGDPVARLRRMIVAHLEVVADNPERSLVVFHQWRFLGPDNLPGAVEQRREYERMFVKVVEEGVREGRLRADFNRRVVVLTMLGALNWTPEWFSPDGRLSPAEVGELMADTLLGGILADP
ncbi:TetR/AcrR family transcriptional regulator [Sphingopyxis sp.]|jgi:AcrR family transcriptional regulator|uniref:TetR/AcrR family transcriptional regulator n=1 Tax=Sphingopyxis sp. TaxID=1908224 RepID=UPI002DFB236F|nr:TetR/AcrR family transcriptional regulator [Sphingopyxis sp.]